jgi:hypothetical protein
MYRLLPTLRRQRKVLWAVPSASVFLRPLLQLASTLLSNWRSRKTKSCYIGENLIECPYGKISDNTEERLLKEHTKAYMAGMMDAEGTFTITTCTHKSLGHQLYDPCIRMTSTCRPVVDWAVENFGGTIYGHKLTGTSKLERWDWSTDSYSHSSAFLSLVSPYLLIKRDEAKVLEEFYSLYRKQVPTQRAYLCEKLKALKKRESLTTNTQELPNKDNLINAYFAGFFDGEGTVRFTKNNGYDDVRISLGNTAKSNLELLKTLYGGHTYTLGGESRPQVCRQPMWQWQLDKKSDQVSFLLKVIPYLKIKRDRAKEALVFIRKVR